MSQPSVVVLDDSDDGGAPVVAAATAFSAAAAAAPSGTTVLDLTFAPAEVAAVRESLLAWYAAHRRKLPWRGDPPPYTSAVEARAKSAAVAKGKGAKAKAAAANAADEPSVDAASASSADAAAPPPPPPAVSAYGTWVSEVMLQQTRVEAVCEYWTRWMARFPTVQALADAPEDDVVAAWAGLGYYRRARNLRKGAQTVVARFGGSVPGTVQQLLELEGVGEYTAGAIASIAFNLPVPLVDGNVVRVFSRLRAASADAKSPALAKACWAAAKGLVDPTSPGAFNQALMELGATVCTPQSPTCGSCPLRATGVCRGYAAGLAALRDGSLDAAVAAAEGGGSSGGDIEDLGAATAAASGAAAEQAPAAKRPKQASLLGFFKKAPAAAATSPAAAEPAAPTPPAGGNSGAAPSSSSSSSSAVAAPAGSPSADGLSPDEDLARVGRYVAARYPLKAAKKASPTERVAVAVIAAARLPQGTVGGGTSDDGTNSSVVVDGPFFLFIRDNGEPPAAEASGAGKKGKKGAAAAAKTSALLERQWQPLTVSLGRVAATVTGDDGSDDEDGDEEGAASPAAGKGKAGGKRRRPASAAAAATPAAPSPAAETALLVEGAQSQLGLRVTLPDAVRSSSSSSSSASQAPSASAAGSPLALASAAPAGRVGHVFSHVTHDVGVHAWWAADSDGKGVPAPVPRGGLEARWARPADFPALGLTTWACKVLHPALKAQPGAAAAVAAVAGSRSAASAGSSSSSSSSSSAAADAAGWRWLAERWAKAGLKR